MSKNRSAIFMIRNYMELKKYNRRIANYKKVLTEQFTESRRLEEEIMKQLDTLKLTINL